MRSDKMTKTERSWAVYDCGCSAFSMLLTAIIPIYIKAVGSGAGFTDAQTTAHWGVIQSVSTLAVALLAPVLGAMADFKGRKKIFFNVFLFMAVLSLFFMAFADNYYILLAINFIAMALRNVVTVFLTGEDYRMAVDSMDHFVKQILFSGIVGAPLCLLEALIGKHVSLELEDSQKEQKDEGKSQ